MSFLTVNFESQFLNGNTDVNIILPDKPQKVTPQQFYRSGGQYKVLWLLHGGGGDYSDWVRKSRIELFATENDLVVVMPSAQNSQYTNWPTFADGFDVYRYILDELMPMVYAWLPVSPRKEDNYIAGLSMGGNGACKFVFTHPERFAGAAVFSSCPRDYSTFFAKRPASTQYMMADLGANVRENGKVLAGLDAEDAFLQTTDNTRRLLQEIIEEGRLDELPPMLYTFGDKDHHFEEFVAFLSWCDTLGYKPNYIIGEGFAHEWRFWDLSVEKALAFFGFQVREQNQWVESHALDCAGS